MAHVETLKDVPSANVAAIKTSYEQEGATVIVVDQGGGLSTLVAIFPDDPTSGTAKTVLSQGVARS